MTSLSELVIGCACLATLGTGSLYALTADPAAPSSDADDVEVCQEAEVALARFTSVATAAAAGVASSGEAAEATRTATAAFDRLTPAADDDALHDQLVRVQDTLGAFRTAVADRDRRQVRASSQAAQAHAGVLVSVCREVEEQQ